MRMQLLPGLALLALLALPARADMMLPPALPPQMLVTHSDLIIVATPTDMTPPGTEIRKLTLKVEKVIKNDTAIDVAGKNIAASYIHGAGRRTWLVPIAGGLNQKQILCAKRVGEEWKAVPFSNAAQLATDETVKAFEKAADVASWNWGKEVDGLVCIALPMIARGDKAGGAAHLTMVTGLRNVSKKPLTLNFFPVDNCFGAAATVDDTPIAAAPAHPARGPATFAAQDHTVTVAPGAVVWLSTAGANTTFLSPYTLGIGAGKVHVRATYTNRRAGDAAAKLWQGTVESAPAAIQVQPG